MTTKVILPSLSFLIGIAFGGFFYGSNFFIFDETEQVTYMNQMGDEKKTFSRMQRQLYSIATQPPKTNNTSRTMYMLGDVVRTDGGLSDLDRQLIGQLYYNVTSLFEFGLGESTMIAAHVGVPRYAGVDSDATWVAKARNESKMDHFRFYFADVSETGSWGHPKNTKLSKIPYNYQVSALSSELEAFDMYLIDGRYRVACACAAMLHAMSLGGDMSSILFGIHDFVEVRHYYQPILEVADVVHSADFLKVFKVKPNLMESEIFNLWQRHIWDERR